MKDQAEKLRILASQAKQDFYAQPDETNLLKSKTAKVVAITSGKGGVGKSNLACNLAINLSRKGKKVALFDADLGLANIDVILGISPHYNLTHVVKGEKSLADILVDGPEGIKIVAGGSGVYELAQLNLDEIDKLTTSLINLEEQMDIILIDTGAGLSSSVLNFVLAAHEIIVVTIPEPTAIADAYGIIKSIFSHNAKANVNLLVNRAINKKEAQQVASRLNNVSQQFIGQKIDFLGYVVEDNKIGMSVRKQQPFTLLYPRCSANQCLETITEKIIAKCFAETEKEDRKNLFQRLFNFWS